MDFNFVISKLLPKCSQYTIFGRYLLKHNYKYGKNSTLLYKLFANIKKITVKQDVYFYRLTGLAPLFKVII